MLIEIRDESGNASSRPEPPGVPSMIKFSPRTIVISESFMRPGTLSGFRFWPASVSIRTNSPFIELLSNELERMSGPIRE